MEIIKYLISAFLSFLYWPLALVFLSAIIIWTAIELSKISGERNFIAKLSRLGRAVLITLTGSYFGGLYIDGIGGFPSNNSSLILCLLIILLSLILWMGFISPNSR